MLSIYSTVRQTTVVRNNTKYFTNCQITQLKNHSFLSDKVKLEHFLRCKFWTSGRSIPDHVFFM